MNTEINGIKQKLEALTSELVSRLNDIYQLGIPAQARKLVIWVPLGHRYNLTFTYMTDDANEAGGPYPQLASLNDNLEGLVDNPDSECSDIDQVFAAWLKDAIAKSSFAATDLPKVMAINNVCAYFDLDSLELLSDADMWS